MQEPRNLVRGKKNPESDPVSFQSPHLRTSLAVLNDLYRGGFLKNKHKVYKVEVGLTIWTSQKDLKIYRKELFDVYQEKLKSSVHTWKFTEALFRLPKL